MKGVSGGISFGKYILLTALMLLTALILSIAALQSVYESREDYATLNLSYGLCNPLSRIFTYPQDASIHNITLTIESLCPSKIDLKLVYGRLHKNITLEPFSSIVCKLNGTEHVICWEPVNCSVRMRLRYMVEYKPYLLLSIPAFILFMVGTGMLVIMLISGADMSRERY